MYDRGTRTMLAVCLGVCVAAFGAVAEAHGFNGKHVYVLHAQNGSRETGTVTLEPRGASTDIALHLVGAPKDIAQPAHVHPGTCADPAPIPKYALAPVVDGASDKVIPVSMTALLIAPMVVEIHKSLREMNVYVACAALKP